MRSKDEIEAELEAPFIVALDKLINNDNNTDKLSKKDCAAVLTLGFDVFTRPTTNEKVGVLQRSIDAKMKETGPPEKKLRFWTEMEKRKVETAKKSGLCLKK